MLTQNIGRQFEKIQERFVRKLDHVLLVDDDNALGQAREKQALELATFAVAHPFGVSIMR
jgi:hypothetical protein